MSYAKVQIKSHPWEVEVAVHIDGGNSLGEIIMLWYRWQYLIPSWETFQTLTSKKNPITKLSLFRVNKHNVHHVADLWQIMKSAHMRYILNILCPIKSSYTYLVYKPEHILYISCTYLLRISLFRRGKHQNCVSAPEVWLTRSQKRGGKHNINPAYRKS